MEMTEIRTARLLLRRVGLGDWQAIRGIWEDAQRQEYAQYDRYNDTSPVAVRARIEKWASARGSMEHMFFAVCLDGAVIGYVALNSRGGAVYVRKDALLNEFCEETRFPFCDRIQVASYANSKTVFAFRPVKPIPKNDDFFENVWRDFRANLW